MKSIQRIMLLVALVVLSVGAVSAAADFTIVNDVMDLPTEPIPESVPAITEGEGVVGLELTRGPGIQPAPLTNGFSSDNWNMPDASREKALAIGAFYQFGLQVEEGYSANVESVALWLRRTAVNAPMNFELQASLDGFDTPGITVAQFNYFGRTSGSALFPNPLDFDKYYHMHSDLPGHENTVSSPGDPIEPIDLSSVSELQNVPGGTEVTFRLYAWGNDKTTNTNTVALGRVKGPEIHGTVEAQ